MKEDGTERIFSSFQVLLGAESGLKIRLNSGKTPLFQRGGHSHLEPNDLRGKKEAVAVIRAGRTFSNKNRPRDKPTHICSPYL